MNLHSTPITPTATTGLDINEMLTALDAATGVAYCVDGVSFHHTALRPCSDLPFSTESTGTVIFVESNMNGTYVIDRHGMRNGYAQMRFAAKIAEMNEVSQMGCADLADYEGFAVTIRIPAPTTAQAAPDMEAPSCTTAIVPASAYVMPVVPVVTISTPIALLPAPAPLITPVTLIDENGRILTQGATGWQAESASSPGTLHTTASNGSTCTCPGHRYKRKCWHTTLVQAHVDRELDAWLVEEFQL